jgi:D-serine deaminase-like pyridoxal phosphate-dependent protein
MTRDLRTLKSEAVGRAVGDVETPALILDVGAVERNVKKMARECRRLGTLLRPHIKVHKSPDIALMQLAAGAVGVTTATVWEARAMIEAGVADVLVANQVVPPAAIAELAELAAAASVSVAVDAAENIRSLSLAATRAGSQFGVLVEVDVGMGRGGARKPDETRDLAELAGELPGLHLRGLMGYEGHCMVEDDANAREQMASRAASILRDSVEHLRRAGIAVDVVSSGGTGTFEQTGALSFVTEIQAGSYTTMDVFHERMTDRFERALFVLGTVTSAHGREAVVDAGRKAISTDAAAPAAVGRNIEVIFANEEHLGLRVTAGDPFAIGDKVLLVPGYAPTAVNLYDAYLVVRDGTITDVWPIRSRYGTETIRLRSASAVTT